MAETLLAIVLVTSSTRGESVVCRWPPSPKSSPRLARPRLATDPELETYDNPWRAAHSAVSDATKDSCRAHDEWDYVWQRPNTARDRSVSFSHSASHSHSHSHTHSHTHSAPSGRTSPAKDGAYDFDSAPEDTPIKDHWDDVLGYSSEYLANMLSPKRALCHQKFILAVDELMFVGHPVCAESDGSWKFKQERPGMSMRGRVSKKRRVSGEDLSLSTELEDSRGPSSPSASPAQKSSSLLTFHVVFVHDLPDPSSSASGNLQKYFDIIYQQVAFTLTAVLFQEQVLSNFVEQECDDLGGLKEKFAAKDQSYDAYMAQALLSSSIASALKTLYEAIKSRSLAHLTIHNLPLELQLPPYLDSLLHSEDEADPADLVYQGDGDTTDQNPWGPELSFAWRLPSLEPWKSLLLLDGPEGREWIDVYASIRGSNVREEDRMLAEQLIKFLEMADVTLSLVDMASLLDWDLESQVFPIVRWLVHHRRAKVVDIVHRGLKTVFTVPNQFDAPIKELATEFREAFPDRTIPSLPQLLSTISASSANHFYATIVKTKDRLPLYHDVVLWMLQRGLLVTLHLRIRIVVPVAVKQRVQRALKSRRKIRWQGEHERGRRERSASASERDGAELDDLFESSRWLALGRRESSSRERRVEPPILEVELDEEIEDKEVEDSVEGEGDELVLYEDSSEPTLLSDPARATFVERQWLQAMSEGKDEVVARRFEQINQYFDGKCTDDEILFRAEISRKQLREVLHHYEEFVRRVPDCGVQRRLTLFFRRC
ncbi:hypothetical protein FA95DRAFT_1543270 [Auriscalpium vulgare]|uniref:Uncharacterized protein n=1 Tax=Auriscalpium vulgare TaxID=40419 RepID=A0ACB8RP09_9AGAM|nr:hypothetical protein FA95DRAFT_1543270 [Auriscalpium vulgare]